MKIGDHWTLIECISFLFFFQNQAKVHQLVYLERQQMHRYVFWLTKLFAQ